MQHHHRLAVRVAALLDIDPVPIAHLDHALVEGLDGGMKMRDGAAVT